MTQQFDTINDALKWCIDHPDQRLRDKDGREIWCVLDLENNASIRIAIGGSNMFPSELKGLDLPTLRPLEAEPEKPTLENLAALENWDWFKVTLPNSSGLLKNKARNEVWTHDYLTLQTALSAGWPVEFGRYEK